MQTQKSQWLIFHGGFNLFSKIGINTSVKTLSLVYVNLESVYGNPK